MGPDTRSRCFLPKDRLSSLSSLFRWADCYYFLSTGEIKCLVHFGAVGSAREDLSFSILYWLRRRSSDQDFYFYSGRLSPFQHRQRGAIAQSLSLSFWKKSDFWELLTFIYLLGASNLVWSCKNVQKHEPDESHIKYKLKHTSGCQTKVAFPQRDVITASAAPATKSTDQSNTVLLLQTGRINPPELWEAARKAQTPADNLRWPPLLAVAASDPLPPPAGSGGCRPIRERLGARGAFRR